MCCLEQFLEQALFIALDPRQPLTAERRCYACGMKRLLLLLPLLLSACTPPVDYLRCDAMFRAKARVEERLRDAVSDPVASADLLKVNEDLKTEGCF